LKIPTRICYEKEFEIKSPGMVIDGLELIDLKPYRRKIKKRIAYVLNGVKFDIDLYQQID
jgi:adenylate cyclase class IV